MEKVKIQIIFLVQQSRNDIMYPENKPQGNGIRTHLVIP